eukprot:2213490-Rhodomonas_salina.1
MRWRAARAGERRRAGAGRGAGREGALPGPREAEGGARGGGAAHLVQARVRLSQRGAGRAPAGGRAQAT